MPIIGLSQKIGHENRFGGGLKNMSLGWPIAAGAFFFVQKQRSSAGLVPQAPILIKKAHSAAGGLPQAPFFEFKKDPQIFKKDLKCWSKQFSSSWPIAAGVFFCPKIVFL